MYGVTTEPEAVYDPPEEDEMTPAECYDHCAHRDACRMQLARRRGWDVDEDGFAWMDELARDLGCDEECECFEEIS